MNTQTKKKIHQGTSPVSEEAAFQDAINTIDIKALTSSSQELAEANKDLHARIQNLESKLETSPTSGDETSEGSASATTEGDIPPTQQKKVRKKRQRKPAQSLDLPNDDGVGISRF